MGTPRKDGGNGTGSRAPVEAAKAPEPVAEPVVEPAAPPVVEQPAKPVATTEKKK